MPTPDAFYVGWVARAPEPLAVRIRATVATLLAIVLAVAAMLASTQEPFDPGTFEYGIESTVEGVIVERPYPVVLVADGHGGFVSHLLVAFGKHGAGDLVAGLDGRAARVTGSRIRNDRDRMIEVHEVSALAGDAHAALEDAAASRETVLGTFTLAGEIVDSKCHLGVMKPGRGRGHRACAILCIRGGIPPVFRVEDRDGGIALLLLVDVDGAPVNERVLDMVADPVEITGRVARRGDRLVLYADPATYARIPS